MSSQFNRDFESAQANERSLFDRIFRDSNGNIVIIQPPNLPILVGTAATLLHFVAPNGTIGILSGLVGFGTLYSWAWLELFSGVNYFRQGLGLVSLIGLIALGYSLFSV
ncbi:hypothetical protein [Leptolyngbya sp. FACHB-711]|uniref:hypothetical protein n=1 Tax=unclassified Leptolyngbya TaxID=2650499 RepID=UPI001688F988|nr:hypothetical protein [Leptolyngbya sp. FACHB-711]MBD1849705.1 hypothetical protein [Cyanobacteria bacterium FACHB-502]MBD2027953.1 hypothetical protein [Leptolyngbya sp. FACHB-711]